MKTLSLVLAFSLVAVFGVANADDRAPFYGTWGTEEQCARAPLLPGGSVMSEPFVITEEEIQHGQIWCRLAWFPVEARDGELFTGGRARCGEDTVRDYMLGLTLADDELTMRWDFPIIGPLARCAEQ